MTIYELRADRRHLAELLNEATTPEELQAITDTIEGLDGTIEHKLLDCAAILTELDVAIEGVAGQRKRLAAREKTIINNRERLAEYMRQAMEDAQLPKLKDARFTVSIQANPAAVHIDNEDAVPAEFKKTVTTTTVQKIELAKALKAGTVPGAHLEQTTRLVIR